MRLSPTRRKTGTTMAQRELRFAPREGAVVWGPDGGAAGVVLAVEPDPPTSSMKVTFRAEIDGEYQTIVATYSREDLAMGAPSLLDWEALEEPVSEPDGKVAP